MDVKKILRQYQPALRYAQKCFEDLDDAREASVRSPRMDGMPRGGGGGGLEEQIARIDALERRAAKAREKALVLAEEIEEMIELLEDYDQKAVIRMRYIKGETWEGVATNLYMSERTACRIHGRALEELRRKRNGMGK